ncbi:MAG TPA: exonuclease SbcCD subunit D [Sporichthyaceae bacterium]|jgi:exonuclease SbcD|nr:exonuclease SbcCD subunit D [Sporichthyaceae bacterium]
MRLLHTSDWHLGRSLHRADLLSAQAAFLDHLVAAVRSERIDAVLVSGDVYDRALPPVEAVGLFDEALHRLTDAGARIVLISGNHDSARRLGVNSRLLERAGVFLRTRPADVAQPVLLHDEHGPVAIYPIPYLEPAAVAAQLPGRSHAAVLGAALAAARADLAARGEPRSVVLAHAWVNGARPCESERDISVGGVAAVPTSLFDGFGYVALGHLHAPQTLGATLRYSGSPLPYSFSEAGQAKVTWLVEVGVAGVQHVEAVPAPVDRGLSVLRGRLSELLVDPALGRAESDFVSATLTDPARPEAAMERLRTRFPHALVLAWEPAGAAVDTRCYRERSVGRTDLQLAVDFVAHVRGTPAEADEAALFERALEAVRVGDESEAGHDIHGAVA